MSAYRYFVFLLTLLLLLLSIYETWATGRIYELVPIIAFSLLLPYEYYRAFLGRRAAPKPRERVSK